ncbi:DUF2570 domain-containing protein [Pectobacterium parmentieri]|uniref:DUF2570 domain-containing protein n=1 Tax=Pectobacterium parmentieri TaxID=1905730 RepID=UPI000D620CC1|nr:DUF2570 domain-containing protein [Pectobacterium parmentieri]PWD66513.1 DUF2570 domain-containing protein [Pectobacterium parmentieri]
MPNIQAIKSAIPLLFAFLIIAFITKLGYDNIQLESDNATLRGDVLQLNKKNDGLAESIKTLAEQAIAQNDIVKAESKRRAAAEMKQQRLQDEVKQALRESQPSVVALPYPVLERLREKSDSVRNGKSEVASDTSEPAK